jgi:hypothetical protein
MDKREDTCIYYYMYIYMYIFQQNVFIKWILDQLITHIQGRNYGGRQPTPGHPFSSLKNKNYTVKNIFFNPNILFIWTGHPISIVSGSAPAHVHRHVKAIYIWSIAFQNQNITNNLPNTNLLCGYFQIREAF